MNRQLQFGFEGTRMCLDTPRAVFESAMTRGEYFARILGFQANQGVVTSTPHEDGMRLVFNTPKIGRIADRRIKINRCKQVVTAIDEICERTPASQQDPSLSVEIGTSPIGDSNRYGFDATLKWPDAEPRDVQAAATIAMTQTAQDLRYMPRSILAGSVYAIVDRQNGVTLETNPMGSCTLDTDGNQYDPGGEVMDLYAHNLYSHEMQLICLSGLIAVARA